MSGASVRITDPYELAKLVQRNLIQARIELQKGKITDEAYANLLHFSVVDLAEAIEKITEPVNTEGVLK